MTITQFNERIEENTKLFLEVFGMLSDEQLNIKPNAKTWSIAQNIEHLTATNKSYFPTFEQLSQACYDSPFIARLGFMAFLYEKMILRSVNAERKQRIKTFPVWEPSASAISKPLEDFVKSQKQFVTHVKDCWPQFEKGMVITSPANKQIVYRLPVLLQIVTQHQLRHFNQAKEVFEQIA